MAYEADKFTLSEEQPIVDRKPEYIEMCPECKSKRLSRDYERAELVCNGCGLVVDSNIMDMGPEWRAFDNDQRMKRSRTGAPLTYMMHDKGLSTVIDWRDKDTYGRDISPQNRAQMYRLRKWQHRMSISNAKERNLSMAFTELNKISSKLGLPKNVREVAAVVYRKAVDKKLIRGRSIESVTAASIYAACRKLGVPRTLDEIAEASAINRKEIGRTYRYISRHLGINLHPTSPVDYVARFSSELNLSQDVQSKAIEILKIAMGMHLTSGRGPTGVSASAIYIAGVLLGEKVTQKSVAEVAGVTEVTIRNRYKELAQKLDIEVTL